MVQAQHLRPLVGFMVVCCAVAAVLSSGLTRAVTQVVPRIDHALGALPPAADVVLGHRLDAVPVPETHVRRGAHPSEEVAASQVLRALGAGTVRAGSTTAPSTYAAGARQSTTQHHAATQHSASHTSGHATAPASHATAPTAPTAKASVVTPTATPASPAKSSAAKASAASATSPGLALGHRTHPHHAQSLSLGRGPSAARISVASVASVAPVARVARVAPGHRVSHRRTHGHSLSRPQARGHRGHGSSRGHHRHGH